MRTSDRGVVAIAVHEGIVPYPYLDSVGVLTVGVGHTAAAGPPDPAQLPLGQRIPITDVLAWFRRDLAKFEDRVNAAVKVEMAQHEFDACVSFDLNTGGIHRAKLTEALNRGDRAGAAEGFMGWLRPPEIRGRREAEMRLFRDGEYPEGDVPVWSADSRGKLAGIERRMPGAELLRLLRLTRTHAGTVL